jgi:hypothetical protein
MTQVCSLTLSRAEVQQIVLENLLTRGGDPSYDFSRGHPIFLWGEDGGLTIRFVQGAVVSPYHDDWFRLKPVATSQELDKILKEREAKASQPKP